jgi:membrane-bound serine protease (ClpP class)
VDWWVNAVLRIRVCVASILFSVLVLLTMSSLGASGVTEKSAVLVDLEVTIDGGTVAYVERVVSQHQGRVLVFRVNSYGGYLVAADKIVNVILEKNIECYTWIPQGGFAVSAAAYISLACRGIYIGPGAVIGGISPVLAEPKVVEYVKARVTSLLERVGVENASKIAEELVVYAKTYTASEASKVGLATEVESLDDVLRSLNLRVEAREEPSMWEKLLSVLSNPIVSQIMLLAGTILILVEVFTTGFQGYGVAGAIMIILALYSMALLPVEILHLVLVVSGGVLLGIEIFTPGFGVFGIAGIALVATGLALTLSATPPQALTPPIYATIGGLLAITGLFLYIAYSAAKTARIKRKSREEILEGAVGYAKTDVKETEPGVVYVAGEDWTAYSVKGTIPQGSRVRVVRVNGLKLYVEKVD